MSSPSFLLYYPMICLMRNAVNAMGKGYHILFMRLLVAMPYMQNNTELSLKTTTNKSLLWSGKPCFYNYLDERSSIV